MQRRDTLPRLLPGVPGRSPRRVGVSPCGGGRAGLPCPPSRWSGGSRAPLFRSMRTWGGRRLRRRGRAPGGSPLSGQPERSEGKGGRGRPGDCRAGRSRPQSGARTRRGGVDLETALAVVGSRAVGCADHARASGRDAPPYALLHFGADFSTFRVETHFSQGAHGFPMAHSSLFQWAIGGPRGPHTPGIVVALRGRWPTRRGPCVTRGPRIPTALLAPSGRSTRPLCTV